MNAAWDSKRNGLVHIRTDRAKLTDGTPLDSRLYGLTGRPFSCAHHGARMVRWCPRHKQHTLIPREMESIHLSRPESVIIPLLLFPCPECRTLAANLVGLTRRETGNTGFGFKEVVSL